MAINSHLLNNPEMCYSFNDSRAFFTLTDIGPAVAASKHTTAPVNHTRPSPRRHSPDVTTPSETTEPDYCLLLIYRSRKDERLSWPSWLTCSGGWFTHISGHPSAAGRAQDSESTPTRDRRSTAVLHNSSLGYICCLSVLGVPSYRLVCLDDNNNNNNNNNNKNNNNNNLICIAPECQRLHRRWRTESTKKN